MSIVDVRKKRNIEKALYFTGSKESAEDAKALLKNALKETIKSPYKEGEYYLRIDTLCNGMREAYGDQWIVATKDGTYFIWPDSMFRARYEILTKEEK